MNRLILIAMTLASCTEDDAPSCDTFRVADYQQAVPTERCVFDVSGLDWEVVPPIPPASAVPHVIGGHCGDGCEMSPSVAVVSGETFSANAITWIGDTAPGVAIKVGNSAEGRCAWVRCQ